MSGSRAFLDQLMRTRRAIGYVRRFHTTRVSGESQTLAQHCFGVVNFVRLIAGDTVSVDLLLAAMDHDNHELWTGDVPAPAKWSSLPLRTALTDLEISLSASRWWLPIPALTDLEAFVLKVADMLDLLLYCREQEELGVSTLRHVYTRGMESLKILVRNTPAVPCSGFSEVVDTVHQIIYLVENYHVRSSNFDPHSIG